MTRLSTEESSELRTRRKAQPYLGTASAGLGLGAAGAQFGGAALHRVGYKGTKNLPGMFVDWVPRAGASERALKVGRVGSHLKMAAVPLAITSGAVGGVNGLNSAAIARKQNKKEGLVSKGYLVPIGKSLGRNEMVYRDIRKEMVIKAYRNSQEKDLKRAEKGALIGSGLSFGVGSVTGRNILRHHNEVRRIDGKLNGNASALRTASQNNPVGINALHNTGRGIQALQEARSARSAAAVKTGLAGALGVGGLIAANRIGNYRRTGGREYTPRYGK